MSHKFIKTWSEFMLNETLNTHDIDLTIRNAKDELSLLGLDFQIIKKEETISVKLKNFDKIYGVGQYIDILNNLLITWLVLIKNEYHQFRRHRKDIFI